MVEIDGEAIKKKDTTVYLIFNKPVGITCTTDLKDKHNIISFIHFKSRIFPIGRLDKPSEGLIFLTNDGDIVNKILRAGNNHEKEYVVTVDKPISGDFVNRMSNGIRILDTVTKKCFVKQEGKNRFRIILTQGLNRQIRRMCLALGYNVTTLKRVRIMNISLANLPIGKWRNFTDEEIKKMDGKSEINPSLKEDLERRAAILNRETKINKIKNDTIIRDILTREKLFKR